MPAKLPLFAQDLKSLQLQKPLGPDSLPEVFANAGGPLQRPVVVNGTELAKRIMEDESLKAIVKEFQDSLWSDATFASEQRGQLKLQSPIKEAVHKELGRLQFHVANLSSVVGADNFTEAAWLFAYEQSSTKVSIPANAAAQLRVSLQGSYTMVTVPLSTVKASLCPQDGAWVRRGSVGHSG